jgi:hypothetical protein
MVVMVHYPSISIIMLNNGGYPSMFFFWRDVYHLPIGAGFQDFATIHSMSAVLFLDTNIVFYNQIPMVAHPIICLSHHWSDTVTGLNTNFPPSKAYVVLVKHQILVCRVPLFLKSPFCLAKSRKKRYLIKSQ